MILKLSFLRTCNEEGMWSGAHLECEAWNCESPPSLPESSIHYTSVAVNSPAVYLCNAGFALYRNSSGSEATNVTFTATCNEERQWESYGESIYAFKCEPLRCHQPPGIPNAAFDNASVEIYPVNVTIRYRCLSGYRRLGLDPVLTCNEDAEWSFPFFECVRVDCGRPPHVANARFTTDNGTREGSVAVYTCEDGYTLTSRKNSRSCGGDSLWTGEFIECLLNGIKHCGEPPEVEFATVSVESTREGETAIYSCQDGYTHSWANSVECSATFGAWRASPVVKCVPMNCGEPPAVENARAVYTNTTLGDTVYYICRDGMNSSGDNATCLSTGTWTAEVPLECLSRDTITCGPAPKASNSYVQYVSTVVGSVANYSCDHGFHGEPFKAQCESNGIWSLIEPYGCSPVECGSPPVLPNAESVLTSGTTYGQVAVYQCETGYTHTGPSLKTCQADQTWSSNLVECVRESTAFCADPPSEDRLNVHFVSRVQGALAEYTCGSGYIDAIFESLCSRALEWMEPDLFCEPMFCSRPTPIEGAIVVPDNDKTRYGGSVVHVCGPSMSPSTDSPLISTCLENGVWSPVGGVCLQVVEILLDSCDSDPPEVSNGQISLQSGTYIGAVATYSCAPGYYPVPPADVFFQTCLPGRVWSSIPLTCMPSLCWTVSPPSVSNAELVSLELVQGIADTVMGVFNCSRGYRPQGSSGHLDGARCHYFQGWDSTTTVSCAPVDCGQLVLPGELEAVRLYHRIRLISFRE